MASPKANTTDWIKTNHKVFWGEIAPCDHVVQIYESDDAFLNLLHGFVHEGVSSGDSVIVIATEAHIRDLNQRLTTSGHIVNALIDKNLYIPLDADKTLSEFMVNDWPDENLFRRVVSDVISRAKKDDRRVRAFGEMVALLWAKGQIGATVRLEQLWNKFCESEAFCLFCAYPKGGFTQDASESLTHICCAHSRMIAGDAESVMNVLYKDVDMPMAG
jgi:hypothetical protein